MNCGAVIITLLHAFYYYALLVETRLSADCCLVCSVSVKSDGAGWSRFPVRVSFLWASGYRTLHWNAVFVNKADGVWPECSGSRDWADDHLGTWSTSGEPPRSRFEQQVCAFICRPALICPGLSVAWQRLITCWTSKWDPLLNNTESSVQEEFSLAVQIRNKKVSCTPTKVHSEGHLLAWNTPSEIPHIPQPCADIALQNSEVGRPFKTTRLIWLFAFPGFLYHYSVS